MCALFGKQPPGPAVGALVKVTFAWAIGVAATLDLSRDGGG